MYDDEERTDVRETIHAALDDISSMLEKLARSWRTAQQAHSALSTLQQEYAVERRVVLPALPEPVASFDWDVDALLGPDVWTGFEETWQLPDDPLGLRELGLM